MANALALGASAARLEGSSPSLPTIAPIIMIGLTLSAYQFGITNIVFAVFC